MKALFLTCLLACTVLITRSQDAVKSIDKITNNYIGIKNALAADNSKLANSQAKDLYSALSAPVNGLQPAQQKLLAAYLDKLKFDSRHISESQVIDHQREHFASLSKNMYSLLSGLKMNSTTVYQQYCPMKKVYWLSETADIRNPYYGSQMLECGKVTASLKGK